jgi:hypothetical protein
MLTEARRYSISPGDLNTKPNGRKNPVLRDPRHFGTDPDPRNSGYGIRLQSLLFSSVTFKIEKIFNFELLSVLLLFFVALFTSFQVFLTIFAS